MPNKRSLVFFRNATAMNVYLMGVQSAITGALAGGENDELPDPDKLLAYCDEVGLAMIRQMDSHIPSPEMRAELEARDQENQDNVSGLHTVKLDA